MNRARLLSVALLLLTGLPASAAGPPPVAAFAQLPLMSNARLSPDGTHLAYFQPLEGRRYLVVQKLFSEQPPVAVPPVDELDFDWLRWASDERIVFSMSYADRRFITETRETRLLSIARDGSGLTPLVRPATRGVTGSRIKQVELPPPQVQDNVIDWLPAEPNHILVALDEDQDARSEVRRIDVTSGEYETVQRGTRGVQSWLTDRDHEIRIGYGYDLNDFGISVHNGSHWARATGEDWWNDGWRPVAFSDDPARVYVRGPNAAGLEVLRLLDIDTGELGSLEFARDDVDLGDLLFEPASGALVGVSWVDDFERIHYFDEELAGMQAAVDHVFPELVNQLVSYSHDRRRVLVRSFSDLQPPVYRYWDRDRKSMDFLGETMPGLGPDVLSAVTEVRYEARDGLVIPAFLTLPRGARSRPLPAVILPHGGPQARDDRSFYYLSQFLASRGYAVLQPNYRGSTGYGKAFEYAGLNQWGGLMQDDVTDGARWLVTEGIADAARLCIVGWSYGGYAAAMGAVKTPDLYRCAVSINGVLNLPSLIADGKQYVGGSVWTRHIGLTDEKASTVSPYHQAESIRIPMLIVQAADDSRVHADQGRGMHRRLRRLDKPVDYVEVEFGGHGMDNEAAKTVVLRSLESFLGEHLGRAQPADPQGMSSTGASASVSSSAASPAAAAQSQP